MVSRKVAGAVAVLCLLVPSPALGATSVERHHRCQEECDGGGSGNGNSGGEYGGGHSGDQGDGDGSCRNFCNITVPTPPLPGQQPKGFEKPQGFIPPNPGKIPQQVQEFLKLVSDFVIGVTRFAI